MPAEAGRKTKKSRALLDNAEKATLTPNSAWLARTGRQNSSPGPGEPSPARRWGSAATPLCQPRSAPSQSYSSSRSESQVKRQVRAPCPLPHHSEGCSVSPIRKCTIADKRGFQMLRGAASASEAEDPSQPKVHIPTVFCLRRASKTV